MEHVWHSLQTSAVDYAGRLLGAILILVAGWLAIHFLVAPLSRRVERGRLDPSVASFLVNSLRGALLVAVFLGVLQQLGVQTTSLLALLGAAGLAVALSLQNSLANFAAGLVVLAFRMVRVGDLIELADIRGRVTELLPFHILLVTADNQCITVPNTLLTNAPFRNHSTLAMRRAQWTLTLTAHADLAAAKDALRARLQADSRILANPAPQFFIQEWTPDKRTLVATAWTPTADYQEVQQELLEALGTSLDASQRRPGT